MNFRIETLSEFVAGDMLARYLIGKSSGQTGL
jgi:hypothetical protein